MARIINTADIPSYDELPPGDKDWVYNGLDCCVTLEVQHQLSQSMDSVARKTYEFNKALLAPVMEMSLIGLRVHKMRRLKVLNDVHETMSKVEAGLARLFKEGLGLDDFNWRSNQQLIWLFYTYFGYRPVRKRNSKGGFSPTVNRDALEKLSVQFFAEPICTHILTLRDLDKRRQFLETPLDADGRMRCSYNIAGTKTGRLSSYMSDFGTGTNLQNVDRNLRSIFIPDEGMKFCNIDLEQADARNVGAICWELFVADLGEEFAGSYLDACESGDLHTTVCRMAWRDLDWGTDAGNFRDVAEQIFYRNFSYRDMAKRLGHGTNYYGTPPTMSKHTKVIVGIIKEFQERYFEAFPCIPRWHENVQHSLVRTRALTTLFGDRRFFFGRPSDDNVLRAAIAHSPQSMTAKQINIAVLNLWRKFPHEAMRMVGQVHDSLMFMYPEKYEDELVEWAVEHTPTTLRLTKDRDFSVPCEAKVGWNWGDRIYDKKADEIKNPYGLDKWKGHDDREHVLDKHPQQVTLAEALETWDVD